MTKVYLPDRVLIFDDGKERDVFDTLLENEPDVQRMLLDGRTDREIAQHLKLPLESVRGAFKGEQAPQSYWESLYGPCKVEWKTEP